MIPVDNKRGWCACRNGRGYGGKAEICDDGKTARAYQSIYTPGGEGARPAQTRTYCIHCKTFLASICLQLYHKRSGHCWFVWPTSTHWKTITLKPCHGCWIKPPTPVGSFNKWRVHQESERQSHESRSPGGNWHYSEIPRMLHPVLSKLRWGLHLWTNTQGICRRTRSMED